MAYPVFRGQKKLGTIDYSEIEISEEEAKKRDDQYEKLKSKATEKISREGQIRLICGDALMKMHGIESESIDLILTDPPYEQVDYLLTQRLTNMQKNSCVDMFSRILKRTGSIIMFCGQDDKYIWHNLLSQKFIFKRELEMIYPPAFSPPKNFTPTHEGILFFVKTEDYYWNEKNSNISTVYKCKRSPIGKRNSDKDDYYGIPRERLGTTPKPLGLVGSFVETLCPANGVVLDPFMGSGTTGVSCVLKNRNFIGIEIVKNIFSFAEKRIESIRSINRFGVSNQQVENVTS